MFVAPGRAAAPVGPLVDLELRPQTRRRIVEIDADGIDQLGLGAPLHHMDHRLLARRDPGQGRVPVEIVEIFGDGGGFGDERAIVELEHRQHAGAVLGEERQAACVRRR